MTVQELLTEGKYLLKLPASTALIDTPELDAALLLAEILHTSREGLILRGNENLAEPYRKKYLGLLERRRRGECIAYILGRKEFHGLDFAVNPNVLVPRPDTETLLEAALEQINTITGQGDTGLCLLDLCTGSGALAVSLKKERPSLSVTASDISVEALETAAHNAGRLLPNGAAINFVLSDLFENIGGKFKIIVSNPPYVPSGAFTTLAPEVLTEPRLALDAGEDGLYFIKKIISRAQDHLFPGGFLFLEAGPNQMPVIKTLLENNCFGDIVVYKDLAGSERVISARLPRQGR
jgi:release factor glutamine methyltransferase